jgi:hypothetical protein
MPLMIRACSIPGTQSAPPSRAEPKHISSFSRRSMLRPIEPFLSPANLRMGNRGRRAVSVHRTVSDARKEPIARRGDVDKTIAAKYFPNSHLGSPFSLFAGYCGKRLHREPHLNGLELLMPTVICSTCKHQQSLDAAEWTEIEYQAMCEKCGAQLKGLLLSSGARPLTPSEADDQLPVRHID